MTILPKSIHRFNAIFFRTSASLLFTDIWKALKTSLAKATLNKRSKCWRYPKPWSHRNCKQHSTGTRVNTQINATEEEAHTQTHTATATWVLTFFAVVFVFCLFFFFADRRLFKISCLFIFGTFWFFRKYAVPMNFSNLCFNVTTLHIPLASKMMLSLSSRHYNCQSGFHPLHWVLLLTFIQYSLLGISYFVILKTSYLLLENTFLLPDYQAELTILTSLLSFKICLMLGPSSGLYQLSFLWQLHSWWLSHRL